MVRAVGFLFLAVIACEPTIPPPEPAGIKLSPARAELHEVGETVQLRAAVRDEDGKVIEAYEVGWSTSDSSVATVSSSGLVRAEEEDGTATITGTAGSVSATATITVLTNRDWRALRALYNTTDGPNWARNAGWLTDAPLGEWDGVKVNDNGRVIALELARNDLAGVLPGELGLLDELQRLRLGLNDIRGSIPPQIAGSGTTAHAVLAQNREDGGNRRFILIECEDYANSITAERVRRVIRGVPRAKDDALKTGLGGAFSYFELGRPMRQESLLDGSHLPSWEKLASYIFFTATGQEFDPEETDSETGFVGRTASHDVFLVYEPDVDKLKSLALSLPMARALPAGSRRKLVFAPTKYLDREFLHRYRIDFQKLPFQIYEAIERLEA